MNGKKVVIIGAGFGGLSAAALLAKKGFKVTLLEKNDQPGGRARVWKKDGFVFDMGPSWYLMPEVFENFFSQFNKKPSDYYTLKRIDPNYRLFFGNEPKIDIPADLKGIMDVFDKLEAGGGKKLKKYLEVSSFQYSVAMKDFMYKEYRSLLDFMNWELIMKGLKLHILESMDRFARRYFSDHRIRKILEYTVVFLGGSPNNTPALYSIMSHVDFNLGVWYPYGGFGKLAEAYASVAKENGVEILLDQNVKKIEVENGKATRVITDSGEFEADIVVANADYHHVETELLDPRWNSYPESYWRKKKVGPSAFLIYLGLNKKVKSLLHHNLYLDTSWDEHFRSIFDEPKWPDSPSYYLSAPSKTDDTVAPEGCENLFVLVPVAAGLDDNDALRERYFKKTVAHIEKTLGESISGSIIVKRVFAHREFKDLYNSYKGTALGLSHTLFQTALFRPAHRSKKVKNLFYTGSYNHPGIGIPMVTISSQIVSDVIKGIYG